MSPPLKDLMRDALRLTRAGQLSEATRLIQQALRGAPCAAPSAPPGPDDAAGGRAGAAGSPAARQGRVYEMEVSAEVAAPGLQGSAGAVARAVAPGGVAVPPETPRAGGTAARAQAGPQAGEAAAGETHTGGQGTGAPQAGAPGDALPGDAATRESAGLGLPADPGEFVGGSHTYAGLTRKYKLYVPPRHAGRQLPLVVMLHGCTQDPDDFAAGTGMNERAREQGFFVLYPAQSRQDNPSLCWNWFSPEHQKRDAGEPGLIASLTQAVIAQYGVDARRVYIAGLSAGGAMAAIVASAYPELYAAVGVHSGLPRGAASNMMGALAVMKSGTALPSMFARPRAGRPPAAEPQMPVPTIVFHGDADRTVHPRNGEQVIAALLGEAAAMRPAHPAGHAAGAAGASGGPAAVGTTGDGATRAGADGGPAQAGAGGAPTQPGAGGGQIQTGASSGGPTQAGAGARVEHGVAAQGRRYTRSTHHDVNGRALAEHWLVHGAGHAWSGGQAEGSYTDDTGPDATGEMLRFFFAQAQRPLN